MNSVAMLLDSIKKFFAHKVGAALFLFGLSFAVSCYDRKQTESTSISLVISRILQINAYSSPKAGKQAIPNHSSI